MPKDTLELAFEELAEANELLDSLKIKVLCPMCKQLVVKYPPLSSKTSEVVCPHCNITFYVGALYISNQDPDEVRQAMYRAQQAV